MRAALVALALAGCRERAVDPLADPPATAAEARARFCEVVLPVERAARLTGVAGLVRRPSARPPVPGVGECLYAAPAAARAPGTPAAPAPPGALSASPARPGPTAALGPIAVELIADCRPLHPRLEPTRASLRGQPGFREVAIGLGGFATGDPTTPAYRLVVITDAPSCALYLSTVGLADDRTVALAESALEAFRGPGEPSP